MESRDEEGVEQPAIDGTVADAADAATLSDADADADADVAAADRAKWRKD